MVKKRIFEAINNELEELNDFCATHSMDGPITFPLLLVLLLLSIIIFYFKNLIVLTIFIILIIIIFLIKYFPRKAKK